MSSSFIMPGSHPFSPWKSIGVISVTLLAIGCSSDDRIAVYPVSGTVMVQGRPADNAQVTLHPVNPEIATQLGSRPMAFAGADGKFVVTSRETGDGAPAGDYVVTIEWRARADGPFDPGTHDMLGGRFANPASSPLRAKVEPAATELPVFNLQ